MSDVPDISETEELGVVTDLVERQRNRLIEDTNEQIEQNIRQMIERVDWSESEVLDVVHKTHIDQDSFTRSHGFQYHAYESAVLAPDTETYYGIGDHHKQVYRVTEHVCREIGVDPETGEDVDD